MRGLNLQIKNYLLICLVDHQLRVANNNLFLFYYLIHDFQDTICYRQYFSLPVVLDLNKVSLIRILCPHQSFTLPSFEPVYAPEKRAYMGDKLLVANQLLQFPFGLQVDPRSFRLSKKYVSCFLSRTFNLLTSSLLSCLQ